MSLIIKKEGCTEYTESYKIGNATINIVAPKNKTREEMEKTLKDFHEIGWQIIQEMAGKGEII